MGWTGLIATLVNTQSCFNATHNYHPYTTFTVMFLVNAYGTPRVRCLISIGDSLKLNPNPRQGVVEIGRLSTLSVGRLHIYYIKFIEESQEHQLVRSKVIAVAQPSEKGTS